MHKAVSPDYQTARGKFRRAVSELNWQLESHSIGIPGPHEEDLTIDVALHRNGDSDRTLVLSSGVHGVEGFFGSAVQIATLNRWAAEGPPEINIVLMHGLNPYGFAYLRRFDENNIDPNRNCLLPDESFSGAPPEYEALDGFLNPQRPPSRLEPFTLKALWTILRYGMPALRRSVAVGQYEYPRGLFFGGKQPCSMQRILQEHLPRWLAGSAHIVHLDFHTGLGPYGDLKLLIDSPLSDTQREQLKRWFGPDAFEELGADGIAYAARGGFGSWCVASDLAAEYIFACAEFGTYSPVRVLAGLRAENQAHHWGKPTSESTKRAKQKLRELFCPQAAKWRTKVIEKSNQLIDQAINGLLRSLLG